MFKVFGYRLYLVMVDFGNRDTRFKFSVHIKMKIEVVCNNEIVERGDIAVKLFFLMTCFLDLRRCLLPQYIQPEFDF